MGRNSSRVVVLVLTGHALAAAFTWRDIRQQPAQQVRGSKTFWRIFSAVAAVAVGVIQVAGVIYSRIPIASTGRVRSACRVGTDRATRASSAETPRIAANQPAGA